MINGFFVSNDYKKNISNFNCLNLEAKKSWIKQAFDYEVMSRDRKSLHNLLGLLIDFSDRLETKTQNKSFLAPKVSCSVCAQQSKSSYPIKKSFTAVTLPKIKPSLTPIVIAESIDYVDASQLALTRDFLTQLQEVLDNCLKNIKTRQGGSNPPPKPTEEQIFTDLKASVDKLLAQSNYTNEDVVMARDLAIQTESQISRSEKLTPAEKVKLLNELSEEYRKVNELKDAYARSQVNVMLEVAREVIGKATTEEDAEAFSSVFASLTTLSNESNYTEQQLIEIQECRQELSDAINNASFLTRNEKVDYNREIITVYERQVDSIKAYQEIVESSSYASQHQAEIFQKVIHEVTSFASLFAPINLTNNMQDFSAAGATAALQSLITINAWFPVLTDAQKKLVNDCLDGFNPNGTGSSGSTQYDQRLAIVWAYFIASSATAMEPTITIDKVNEAVKVGVNDVPDNGLELLKKVKEKAREIATAGNGNGQQNPSGGVATGIDSSYYTVYSANTGSNGSTNNTTGVNINYRLMNAGDTFLKKWIEVTTPIQNNIAQNYFKFKSLALVDLENLQHAVSVQNAELASLKNLNETIYADSLVSKTGELRALALPSAVATLLIDHYMPREVDFLEDLYKVLYYSNFGSSMGNAILDSVSGFVNAATYFVFASYAGQSPAVGASKDTGEFPGSKASAQLKLETEKKQASLYLDQTMEGLKVVEEQRNRVMEDLKIDSEQRQRLLDMLQGYENSFRSVAANLVTISNFLGQLTVSDGSAGTFKVTGPTGWQDNLATLEDAVISGLPGLATPTGMFTTQATIQADQQSFADMGQNYQLDLQMHITGMQQEWTVVSTSLQVLNQMYLALARSLLG